MSVYPNKLRIKTASNWTPNQYQTALVPNASGIYECSVYETAEEATPVGGSSLKVGVIVDNVVKDGYIALTKDQSSSATPLRVVVGGIEYYIATTGKSGGGSGTQYITVHIEPAEHQTIKFTCNGVTETVTTEAKDFQVPVGADYQIEVIPDEGYNAGTLNVPATGVVSDALENITVSSATPKKIAVTITQVAGGTISVNGHTTSFEADYGTTLETLFTPDAHFSGGTVSVVKAGTTTAFTGTKITEAIEVTASGVQEDAKFTVTLNKGEHIASVTMKVGEAEIQSGASVYTGSALEINATAEEGYVEPTITIEEV